MSERYDILFLAPPGDAVSEIAAGVVQCPVDRIRELPAFAQIPLWLSSGDETNDRLVRELTAIKDFKSSAKLSKSRLLTAEPIQETSRQVLETFFRIVLGGFAAYRLLPTDQLLEVLQRPPADRADVFIGGCFDPASETLVLTRGDFSSLRAPLASFRVPGSGATPDPARLEFDEYGETVKLGDYEAAADAILYEESPEFRRNLLQNRRENDKTFGACLRRLRIQRGLTQDQIPGLSRRQIVRLESGETEKPHADTLRLLAHALSVKPEEIETF